MNGNSPGQTQRKLCKSARYFFFNLLCFFVGTVADIFPLHSSGFDFRIIFRTENTDHVVTDILNYTDFSVVETSWIFIIVADKHDFCTHFQFKNFFGWITFFLKIAFDCSFEFVGFAFNPGKFQTVYLVGFVIMSGQRYVSIVVVGYKLRLIAAHKRLQATLSQAIVAYLI